MGFVIMNSHMNVFSKNVIENNIESDNVYQKFPGEIIRLSNKPTYKRGSFGVLELNENILQPSMNFILNQTDLSEMYDVFTQGNAWHFSGISKKTLWNIFKNSGIDAKGCNTLLKETSLENDGKSLTTKPEPSLVEGFSRQIRQKLYKIIGSYKDNYLYEAPIIYNSQNVKEWLFKCKLTNIVKKKLMKLIYVTKGLCCISDVYLVLPYIKNQEEFAALVQTLYRTKTVDASLLWDKGQNLEKLAAYWGTMSRKQIVLNILKKVNNSGHENKVNISMLLPDIPKGRLNTYSGIDEYKEAYKDCHWTTLNFFNKGIYKEYYNLKSIYNFLGHISKPTDSNSLKYGDIVSIFEKDNLMHSCTYLADNLVLTKNGLGNLKPFVITYLGPIVSAYGNDVTYSSRTVEDTENIKITE